MLIYEPRGRAREYAALACNVYSGCDHRCTYCYAPSATRKTRDSFSIPSLRSDFLRKLKKEAKQHWLNRTNERILLSFTCDPYQHIDVKEQVTRQALEILKARNLRVEILTKGGFRALRDIDLLTADDAFACSLTLLDDEQSLEWEPGAALPKERIYALHHFHEAGIPTWASLEPVIDPAVSLQIIRETHTFVDLFKVGKLNYHPLASTINWRKFAHDAVELLESLNCKYYIKRDLACYLPDAALIPNHTTAAMLGPHSPAQSQHPHSAGQVARRQLSLFPTL